MLLCRLLDCSWISALPSVLLDGSPESSSPLSCVVRAAELDALDFVRARLLGGKPAPCSLKICFRCLVLAAGEVLAISSPDASREDACWRSVAEDLGLSEAVPRFLLLLLDGEDMLAT